MAKVQKPETMDTYEQTVDLAIAACEGDVRATVKALLIANEFLESELEALAMQVTQGLARARTNLARYVGPRLADTLAATDEPMGAIRRQDVAVLFADIRGFTALAERRSPEEIIGLLRAFHGRMTEVVFAHEGMLDKFIGDGLMATFGTPAPGPSSATNALACARAMLRDLDDWNAERRARGEPPIGVGIGLHYGPAVLGDIGGAERFEFAVIGDTVNVASRLERLTRKLDSRLVVGDVLIQRVRAEGAAPELVAGLIHLEPQTLRGRGGRTGVWVLRED